jgi:hypothetical protein
MCQSGWFWSPGVHPGDLDSSFPDGTNGYLEWVKAPNPAWVGLCLDAPSSADPMHAGPTEPLGCMRFSLKPGVVAQMARFHFPADPRWDGFQFCYGAPTNDGGEPCNSINDLDDPTVSPTPVSGSCCSGAQLLRERAADGEWEVGLGQEIPGAPPPVLLYAPDGGIDLTFEDADTFGGVPDECLSAFNEPANCGTPPTTNGPPQAPAIQGAAVQAAGMTSGGKGCAIGSAGVPSLALFGVVVGAAGVVARRRRLAR